MKRVLNSKWILAVLLVIVSGTTGYAQSLKDFFNDKGQSLTYTGYRLLPEPPHQRPAEIPPISKPFVRGDERSGDQ